MLSRVEWNQEVNLEISNSNAIFHQLNAQQISSSSITKYPYTVFCILIATAVDRYVSKINIVIKLWYILV